MGRKLILVSVLGKFQAGSTAVDRKCLGVRPRRTAWARVLGLPLPGSDLALVTPGSSKLQLLIYKSVKISQCV